MYAFHGGKSFEAIGEDFRTLERSAAVINADVLDAWFDPSPRVLDKLERFLPFLVRSSPPARAEGLVEAIAHARGVPEPCVLAGGGSSDLIFCCLPQLVKARQRATILDPMYGEYRHVLEQLIGAELTPFPLDEGGNFGIETQALIQHVRKEIGPIAQPDKIQFAEGLPKTRSGKIMRRILRKIAENDTGNLGDTSTLADPSVVDKLVAGKQ